VAKSEAGNNSDESALGQVSELVDLVKNYAKQETVDPLRSTGRYLARGLIGGFLLSLGLILLAFAGLRAMQDETDAFDNGWSWAPYFIIVAVLGLLAAFFLSRITKGDRHG
jgi:hypothetical protein